MARSIVAIALILRGSLPSIGVELPGKLPLKGNCQAPKTKARVAQVHVTATSSVAPPSQNTRSRAAWKQGHGRSRPSLYPLDCAVVPVPMEDQDGATKQAEAPTSPTFGRPPGVPDGGGTAPVHG